MVNKKIKLVNFPEEVTTEGIRIYGETSYENQIALLSHFLHNQQKETDLSLKEEIILAIREFLSRKESRQTLNDDELSDERECKVNCVMLQ